MNRPIFCSLICTGICALFSIVFFMLWYTTTPQQQPQQKLSETSAMAGLERTTSQEAFTSITIQDLTLKELEKTKELEVIVNAQKCRFLQPADIVECAQVTCTLLDHKTPSAYLKTDKAFINRAQKNIFFSGNVQGTLKDIVLQGTDIHYNFSQQVLQTDKNIEYIHPEFHISAQKSFIDLKNNFIEMMDGVVNEFHFDAHKKDKGRN